MANEVVVNSVMPVAKGLRLEIYLYVPVTPQKDSQDQDIVATPFTGLPAVVQTAWTAETAKQTALNNGTALAVPMKFVLKDAQLATLAGLATPAERKAQLDAWVDARKATMQADAAAAYAAEYRYNKYEGLTLGVS